MNTHSIRLYFFSALLFLQGFSAINAQGDDSKVQVQTEPLQLRVSEEQLEALTPEGKAAFQLVLAQLLISIQRVTGVAIEFPASQFPEKLDQLIGLSKLFVRPDPRGELAQLAGQRLTEQQFQQIRETATYRVMSPRFQQEYVWQVSPLLQRGEKNIRVAVDYDAAKAIYHLTVGIPEAIVGQKPVSFRHAVKLVKDALFNLGDLTIGLKQRVYENSDDEIFQKYSLAKQGYIIKAFGKDAQKPDFRLLDIDSSDTEAAKALGIDSPEALSSHRRRQVEISKIVEKIYAAVHPQFQAELPQVKARVEEEVGQAIEQGRVNEADFNQEVFDRLVLEENARILGAVRQNAELEGLGKGLGNLVANNLWAGQLIGTIQNAYFERRQELIAKKRLELAGDKSTEGSYPILSKVPASQERESWLEDQLNRYAREIDAENAPRIFEEVSARLKEAKLEQEAQFFRLSHQFDSTAELGPKLVSSLQQEMGPRITRSFYAHKGWTPQKWVEKDSSGEYVLNPYRQTEVSSDKTFWRLRTFAHRYRETASTWAYRILRDNLWNGPVGLRALFQKDPFTSEWVVDPKTGNISLNPNRETKTLYSKIQAIRAYVRKSRAEFDARRESGLLGRLPARVGHFIGTDLAVGVGGPILVTGAHIGLTTLNVGASAICLVGCLTPIASAGAWAINAGLYNFEDGSFRSGSRYGLGRLRSGASRLLPPLSQVVIPAGVGVGEGLVAAPVRMSWHGIAGTSRAALGYVGRLGFRRHIYDRGMRGIMRVFGGRTISQDQKYGAKLISGPGLSSKVFFQVDPNLALLALAGSLEYWNANRLGQIAKAKIEAPKQKLGEILKGIQLAIGDFRPASTEGSATAIIDADLSKTSKQLRAIMETQEAKYGDLLEIENRGQIRLKAADLKYVLQTGSALTQKFFTEKMAIWTAAEIEAFWKGQNLSPNDWLGLTSKWLQSTFSEGILSSLEDTDKELMLKIETPRLTEIADHMLEGVDLANLDQRFQVEITKKIPEVKLKNRIDMVRPESACAPALTKLQSLSERRSGKFL